MHACLHLARTRVRKHTQAHACIMHARTTHVIPPAGVVKGLLRHLARVAAIEPPPHPLIGVAVSSTIGISTCGRACSSVRAHARADARRHRQTCHRQLQNRILPQHAPSFSPAQVSGFGYKVTSERSTRTSTNTRAVRSQTASSAPYQTWSNC